MTSDDKAELIRDAALAEFAARGVATTSLREVASAAGVSVGLIQHHFGTKADLVEAVDRHVTEVVRTVLATGTTAITVEDYGQQVAELLAEHTTAVDYLARALADGTPYGSSIFDTLTDMGIARWERRAEKGLAAADLDIPWAAINSVLVIFGTVLLRPHIERHLPDSLLSPSQLARWQAAISALLRRGYLR
ncbi:TetR/AcrR family transcriptional regulator [Mycolicibacterium cosmeticum]|uniref:Transcriptional regulator n=1 Tax=Mycolicibacterium cosmeticum TaxID=258533 RepID=W9B836_MYCCO|nr:TetR/AcrR family transcriptional regulator [Mycolicibacterium cosmeticum]TLH74140.1 TetR/AcrR family transcriptional regulator [Mycolicibacterium cosmeticum]CDO11092.1 transcriptional regulator [Mycolicibacterium cosmeticum]